MRITLVLLAFASGCLVGVVIPRGRSDLEAEQVRVDVPAGYSIDRRVYDTQFVAALSHDGSIPTAEMPTPRDTVKITIWNADGSATSYVFRIKPE